MRNLRRIVNAVRLSVCSIFVVFPDEGTIIPVSSGVPHGEPVALYIALIEHMAQAFAAAFPHSRSLRGGISARQQSVFDWFELPLRLCDAMLRSTNLRSNRVPVPLMHGSSP